MNVPLPTPDAAITAGPADASSIGDAALSADASVSATDDAGAISDATGSTPHDTGSIPDDAGSIAGDAGSIAGDAGSIANDAGSTPDAGSESPNDTGSIADAAADNPDAAPAPDDPCSDSRRAGAIGASAPIASFGGTEAPATIHLHAIDVPLAAGTLLTARYEWDFGDPTGRFNSLVGWNAAHVYDSPGTYCIRLRITDETGAERVFGVEATIANDARTPIHVSQSGDDAADGATPSTAVRTFTRARALFGANKALLFRRGDTFDFPAGHTLSLRTGSRVGAYGTGDRPLIRWPLSHSDTFLSVDGAARDVLVEDLTLDKPGVVHTDKNDMPVGLSARGQNVTVRGMQFLNLVDAINANGRPRGLMLLDTTAPLATGIRGYHVWMEGTDHVFLGNTSVNSTREHIFRGVASRVLIAHNRLSNLDRRPPPEGPCDAAVETCDVADYAKGNLVLRGDYSYATQNHIVHGNIGSVPLCGDIHTRPAEQLSWLVYEANLLEKGTIEILADRVHIRNNIGLGGTCVNVKQCPAEFQVRAEDIVIANNSCANRTTDVAVRVERGATGVKLLNNLHVARGFACTEDRGTIVLTEPDLRAFSEIGRNVWPVSRFRRNSTDGCFYVPDSSEWFEKVDTLGEWNARSVVSDDLLEDLSIDPVTFAPAAGASASTYARPVPGVHVDFSGRRRPASAFAAGAMEP